MKSKTTLSSPRALITALFLALGLSILGGCAQNGVILPQIANIAATSADVEGVWTGTYVCAQGLTGVRLKLAPNGALGVAGAFEFFPLASNPNVPNGSFAVTGVIKFGRLELSPGAWIARPTMGNYLPVRVGATIFSDPDKLVGVVPESNCGRLEAVRTAKSPVAQTPSAREPSPAAQASTTTGVSGPNAIAATGTATPSAGAISRNAMTPQAPAARAPLASGASKAVSHDEFVKRLGTNKSKLVSTLVAFNGKESGNTNEYQQDPRIAMWFVCPASTRDYTGGPLTAKVQRIRDNSQGVWVYLDKCDAL